MGEDAWKSLVGTFRDSLRLPGLIAPVSLCGHGNSGEGGDLVGVRDVAASGDGVPQEVGGSGANFGLGERKFEVVLAEATKGLHVGDVVGGVGVEDDDVVEVRDDAFKAFDDLVNDHNKPTEGGTGALRHHKPLEEPVWRAKRRQRDGILVDGDLVERGDQVEEGENAPFSQKIEDLVDARDGELSEGARGIQLPRVDGDADTRPVRVGDHGAGLR